MKKRNAMTNEEPRKLQYNLNIFYSFQDKPEFIMAHEAGHMVALHKLFPENIYNYGWNAERGVPCVYGREQKHDYSDVSTIKNISLATLAGVVGLCKYLDMTKRETQFLLDCLNENNAYIDGSDGWKVNEFLRMLREQKGVKLTYFNLVGEAYDLLDMGAIYAEVNLQMNMKKTA